VQSIVAGTDISVDATDPANPIVSSTGGGGGGGSATYTQNMGPQATSISTSSFASKGIWFTVDTTITIHSVECLYDPGTSESYKVVIIKEEELIPRQIAAVLGTSNTLTAPALVVTHFGHFAFDTPVQLTADPSAQYAVLLVLTSGTGSSTCRIVFTGDSINPNGPHISSFEQARTADNDPQVGDDFTYGSGTPTANGGVGILIHYTLG
jgi:hypothetical protein